MKRFQKVYLEISNVCNLHCAFCPGTKRSPRVMGEGEFAYLLKRLRPYTDYLYFHLMGEPLFHPRLDKFLSLAGEMGFKVILTTNGILLQKQQALLLSASALHKLNISLHAFEANDLQMPFSTYLDGCFAFGKAAEGKKLVIYRLWNHDGADTKNDEILKAMERYFPMPWADDWRGARIGERVYLDYGDRFEWPSLAAPERAESFYCYGLRDQIGVLADGTVVPCCLDHEGDIALGNLFESDLADILSSPRVKAICNGFLAGTAVEPLCRRCGYAQTRFQK